jgi:hypothetical protein
MFMTICAPIRTDGHTTRIRQHDLYGGARMTVDVQPARTYERVGCTAATDLQIEQVQEVQKLRVARGSPSSETRR